MVIEQRGCLCSGLLPSSVWSVTLLQGKSDRSVPSLGGCSSGPHHGYSCFNGGAGTFGHAYLCVQRRENLRPHPAFLPLQIYHGKIKSKASEPFLVGRNPRVEFVGSTTGKENNISIVLKNVEFSDAGKYTCHVKNPKEKNAQHNATIFLTVVQKSKCWPGVP